METQTCNRKLPSFVASLVRVTSLGFWTGAHQKNAPGIGGNHVLTVSGVRRSALYRPLAIILALLLMPAVPFFEGGKGSHPFQASAQIGGCTTGRGNLIIQNVCAGGVPYVQDLNQLETDAVNGYLALHHLPDADAHVIYDFGRQDLRNAVRANMVSILLGVVAKSPSSRTSHEANLYAWLQALVQQNEISLYTNALDQFNAWRNNPCQFKLDPTIAAAYGLSYDGTLFCGQSLNSLLVGLPVPAEGYFTAYGMSKSYGAPADQFPYFASMISESAAKIGELAGIAAAASAVLSVGLSTALAAALSVTIPTSTSVGLGITGTFYITSFGIFATGGELALGALIGGVAAIVLVAIAIGVTAGMEAFSSATTIQHLNNLSSALALATTTMPDLSSFALDSTGVGSYKLEASMLAQTLPEIASTTALPTHRTGTDWNFVIGATNGSTLTYQDWTQTTWSAQTWGGWFVQTCTSSPANCPQADGISSSIRYVDWSGVKWTASRIADKFVSTKGEPASTDKACPADEITGVSNGPDFSSCSSYYSTSIPLKDAAGNQVRVSLSPLTSPTFTSPASMPFTPGVSSTQTITASGNPTPTICFFATTLPTGFSLNGGACGAGTFQVVFDGNAAVANGNYSLTLVAFNGISPDSTQTFTLNVDQHLGITSPNILTGTAGFPINFLVTTTGNPAPKLTLDPLIPLIGLNFKDNGNGTATIGGVATEGFSFLGCAPTPCGITASNTQGSVTQIFGIQMAPAPAASVVPPNQAQFTAGFFNSTRVQSTGAITPVSWIFAPPDGASWLSLHDNSDGTFSISGTPPAGVAATYNFPLYPFAAGSLPPQQSFTLNVVTPAQFSTANTATFTVGTAGSFPIAVNSGTISLNTALPQGLFFSGGSSASLSGTPAVGTGGQYTLSLSDDAATLGATTQFLALKINEAPKITSPNLVTLFSGVPASFAVSTLGYPATSTRPVTLTSPPTDPSQGDGMYFTVSGLPSSLHSSNLSAQGLATGQLSITGTPTASDIGTHKVLIGAQNAVGSQAQQTLTVQVYALNTAVPVNMLTSNTLARDASNNVVVTLVVANAGGSTAQNVTFTAAKIGAVDGTVLPASASSIASGGTAAFTITFPAASIGARGTLANLVLSGAYTGGTFSSGGRIVLP